MVRKVFEHYCCTDTIIKTFTTSIALQDDLSAVIFKVGLNCCHP